jgi:CRISPR-associated protein Csd2
MNTAFNESELRHDFVWLFDVTDGNPNGDPDNDNLPRTDPETGQGLVTDVCLKRKIRSYVKTSRPETDRFDIYIRTDRPLNAKHEEAHNAVDKQNDYGKKETKKEEKRLIEGNAQKYMCDRFFDVRAFGAVMTTGDKNCGQVRGPMQLTFSRSIDRVFSYDLSITRQAITTSKDFESKETEMGRKALLPYGLYMGYGFFNPLLAKGTGFSDDDLALFWEAMQGMFDLDRSASRGWMELRGLYVFTHEKPTGNAPTHLLFDRIKPTLMVDTATPRKFADYNMKVDDANLPAGITLSKLVG